jgi:hypothetical protein
MAPMCTWSVANGTLTMAKTESTVGGTMTFLGQTQPLPPLLDFSGTARVIDCTPATFKYELAAPTGAFTHTLIAAD